MASTDRIQGLRGDLAIKAPCRVGTTTNITLAGLQTIDGVALAAGDRVLVKDQTDTTENGLYSAAAGAWPRTKDFDGIGDVVNGTQVLITEGSVSAGVFYSVSADEPVIPGASAVVFADSAVAAGAVAAHAADPTAAHSASAISYAGSSGLVATDVEAALDELDSEKQAANADIPTVSASQAEMEAGTEAALRSMSPLRVKQAIAALASVTFASSAENAAGTVENKAVDPLGIREAFNSTGSAPVYACRAWVNFDGTGAVSIRASGNVSSITDNGTGEYTVNFTTTMPDANYAWSGSLNNNGSNYLLYGSNSTAPTASALRISTGDIGALRDSDRISVAVFR